MATSSDHSAIGKLEYRDDCLLWSGQPVTALAERVGGTPFYAYSAERIRRRIQQFREQMPANVSLHYAMKANPHPDVVTLLISLVDGLDVASAGELRSALDCGANPKCISFAGPGKRDAELRDAIRAGVLLNIESETELDRAVGAGRTLGLTPRVSLRVNPAFELKGSGMRMGGRPSQFGIDAERVPAVLRRIDPRETEFRGFHVYAGSQNLNPDAIVESIVRTCDLVRSLSTETTLPIREINLGGGIGIPYFPGDADIDLSKIGRGIAGAIERLTEELDQPTVVMELGRYLVGEAGIYVTKVIDIKESRGTTFAVCDGGFHHHLAVTGNFGQVLRKNYPVVPVIPRDGKRVTVQVVGPLYTPLDLLGDKIEFPGLEVGDLIAILQSGAYGATASPINFLSQPELSEIIV